MADEVEVGLLDTMGVTVKISDIPETFVLRFLKSTKWHRDRNTFFGKYIRPWLMRGQTRIFDQLLGEAEHNVKVAFLNKTMIEGEKRINHLQLNQK